MTVIRQALESAASEDLRAWVQDHRSDVDSAVRAAQAAVPQQEKLRPMALAAPDRSAPDPDQVRAAAEWMIHAAKLLRGATVIVGGVMIQDEIGASYATHAPLEHYAQFDADAPIDIHYRGALAVRVHSHRQIDRKDFETAFAVIRSAWEATHAAEAPDPGPTNVLPIYSRTRGPKSGMADGTTYTWDANGGKVSLFLPMRRNGPTANELLSAAGIPRSMYAWVAAPGSSVKRWLMVDVDWAARVAAAVRDHYPQLAAALDQNAPVWRAEIGRTGTVQVLAPPQVTVSEAEINPDGGTVAGMTWACRRESGVIGFTFDRKVGLQRGAPGSWVKGKDGTSWWYTVAIARLPELEAVLAPIVPAWGVVARVLADKLRPTVSADQGETVDGSWIRAGNSYVIRLAYNADMAGWQRKLPIRGGKDTTGFYWQVQTSDLPQVLSAMAAGWPATADAMIAAIGVKAPSAEESRATRAADMDREAALRELSASIGPKVITHPVGAAQVAHVVNALRVRLPHQLQPRPFQLTGVAFARLAGYRAIIGDAMGLGKTVQALCAIAVDPEKLLPAVVVCPASVVYNWQREARTWLPTVPVHVIASGKTPMPPRGWKGILILSWGLLATQVESLVAWGVQTAVLDEAHYAKEPTSARTKAAFALAAAIPYILEMSGTPILNRVIELWPLLHMINPQRWGSRNAFGHLYTQVKEFSVKGKTITKFEGGVNLDQLRDAIRPYMVRREKNDVLDDLPPKTRVQLPVVMDPKLAREYDAAEREFFAWLSNAYESKIREILVQTQGQGDARKIAEARVERAMAAEELVKSGHLRRILGRAKVPAALDQIGTLLENDEPVVVFVEHQDVLHGIEAGLKAAKVPYRVIEGATSQMDRDAAVQAFQSGKVDVIVCTQAANAGITLTRASHMVFVEYWWVPGIADQAEDRIHRIGQKNAVTIWYPHVPDSMDDDLAARLENKREIVRGAVGDSIVAKIQGENLLDTMRARRDRKSNPGPKFTAPRVMHAAAPAAPSASIPPIGSIHQIVFDKAWTPDQARHWAAASGVPVSRVQRGATVRLEVNPASAFRASTLRAVSIGNGIRAMVGKAA